MSELPKAYTAETIEKKWYEFWEKSGFFTADAHSQKPPFSIVMPPPNVTGVLHMGHALVSTLQDIVVRWKRMSGYEVLWVPGTDHAGIATQTVVERNLFKTTGKKRFEFSRKEFLEHVFTWKEQSEKTIISQIKQLGCSCDWSRKRFTMDEMNNRAVRVMFKKLFDQGLIYRGDYLVNWDPVTQTALADDEVEYEEKEGSLYYFRYPIADTTETITIATTRPETMLGDTAVAVAPKDTRYKHLIGKMVLLPFVQRKIPIIEDEHIDPHFGTGAVKVTPAHDHDDYQIGSRHNLPLINIMTGDGKINEHGGRFQNLSMQEARIAVVEAMKQEGLFVKKEPQKMRVGVSYRSKAVIEPHLSKQWFMKMSAYKGVLKQLVEEKKTKLLPEHWVSTYNHWIDNLRDWCISRQLWWGHQIPIWYHEHSKAILCSDSHDVPEEVKQHPDEWKQDPDVLDTWFSSALWPFSTLGWPEKSADFEKFYPNSCLITGHDILFFWVARMMMMGTIATEKTPFAEVFLHGLIYGKSYWRESNNGIQYASPDERKAYDLGKPIPKDVSFRWEKMSKSKGNVIDPIEISAEYGTDAMRMALAFSATDAPQIDLDRRRFEEFKNFANKIWNGARFVFMNLEGLTVEAFSRGLDLAQLSMEDKWILSRLHKVITHVQNSLHTYSFSTAAEAAYNFFWNEFCAYYVEVIKPVLFGKIGAEHDREQKQKLLAIILLQAIRLLHPMAPFITEELFQLLKARLENVHKRPGVDPYTQEAVSALHHPSCMVAPFPQPIPNAFSKEEALFDKLCECVYAIRNIRGEMKIPQVATTDIHIIGKDENPLMQLLRNQTHILSAFVKTGQIAFHTQTLQISGSTALIDDVQILIPLPKEFMEQEKARLAKEEKRLEDLISRGLQQLENPAFVEKAPRELVQKQKTQIEEWKKELETVQNKIKN
jgi:valyl-tRNA synthetase